MEMYVLLQSWHSQIIKGVWLPRELWRNSKNLLIRKSLKDVSTGSPAVLQWLSQGKTKSLEILEGAIKKKRKWEGMVFHIWRSQLKKHDKLSKNYFCYFLNYFKNSFLSRFWMRKTFVTNTVQSGKFLLWQVQIWNKRNRMYMFKFLT